MIFIHRNYPLKHLCLFIFTVSLAGSFSVFGQAKKTTAKQPAKVISKTSSTSKSDSKDPRKKLVVKTVSTSSKAAAAKLSRAELARDAERKRREDIAAAVAERRREESRKAEAARRAAALAEKRRVDIARAEAAARRRAFESGLKVEARENIASDDPTGEDLEIRRSAVEALGNRAGTVVVMEAQTGKVLTMVNQDWAVRKSFKPCSTIKLVTGVAGLNEDVIDDQGELRRGRSRIGLDDALAHSNNSFFQVAGSSIGSEKLISYAKALGLGEPTGINAEGEKAGRLPYGNNNPRIYSHGDDFEVTPLQLAVMVSALSNGGKLVVPRTPKTAQERAKFQGAYRKEVGLPGNSLQRVIPGMLGAVNFGTARRAYDPNINIAGKTGSCIGQGSWLGLFASVSPVVNPKYAVVVITQGESERGKFASEVAGKVYRTLNSREAGHPVVKSGEPAIKLLPKQKVTAAKSAELDDEEGEESDEEELVEQPQPKRSPKKGEDDRPSVGSKPVVTDRNEKLFEPVIIIVNRDSKRPRIVP